MSAHVTCIVRTARPSVIERYFDVDPHSATPVSGATEMALSTAFGHAYVAEVVFAADEWKVFEDHMQIAKGHRDIGEATVAPGTVKTHYLQTFLNMLS